MENFTPEGILGKYNESSDNKRMIKIYFTVLIILSKIVFSYAQTNDGWWNMEFPDDNFSEEAALDLRFLNEEIAGQNGFIKLSADGKSFITEEGNPIRFWAINGASIVKDLTDEQLSYYARFLAKMGVNLIRFHGAVQPKGGAESLDEVDMNEVEAIWKVVAAMKQEGIYTAISPFWGGYMEEIPASWNLGEYTGESHIWGLMYFNDHLKNAYKKWVEVLYKTVNPYTGIALKDDPAVALIQIKNEDSLLFWTIMGIKPEHKITIEKSFHEWLISKYENIESAFNAWSNKRLPEDNLLKSQVGIYPIWEATIPQSGGKAIRLNDQIEFLSRHQQDFYTEIYEYYRSLGCKQLINANNWRPADPARMFDAERWSNSSVDVMAVNRYYDPGHQGENSSWRIDPDHTYVGESVLINPTKFPINIKQVHDKPFFVTESGWNSPHKYQAEGPFLVAAYMSLTGVDGFFWFSASSYKIDPDPYFPWFDVGPNGNQKAMIRWSASIPGQLSLFPANALLFRKGYISQGAPVVHEERELESLWTREVPLITEEAGFDPNRDSWDNTTGTTETVVAPIAFLAGPVEVKYDGNPEKSSISGDLNNLLDFPNKTVTSNTGQLKWNYEKGFCTMNAPSAQGVVGFMESGHTVDLEDVTITSFNEYAAVSIVSMDDNPLKQSEQILVQVGTIYQPTNWRETPVKVTIDDVEKDGFKITNTGKMPWRAENTKISLSLKNMLITSAYALDQNGYIKKEIFVERYADHVKIWLPANTMYMVLNTNDPTVITGMEEETLNSVKLYPNPTKGTVVLEIPEHMKSINLLQVYDNSGRMVYSEKNIKPGQKQITLPKLFNGIYYIVFDSPKNKKTNLRLLIEN